MNEETVEENLPELSTQERMFLSLRNFKKMIGGVALIAGLLLFFVAMILWDTHDFFLIEPEEGLIVISVMDGYGTQKAGIVSGDVIKIINNHSTINQEGADAAWQSIEPNETISVTFTRDGENFTVPVETVHPCPYNCNYPENGFLGVSTNFESNLLNGIALMAVLILSTVIGLIIWLIVYGNKWHDEIDDIRRDYTNQEYFFALGTSTYGEAEDISMDFLDLAIEVFPELKKYELEQTKKTGEEMEVEKSVIEGKKGKSKDYIFDVFAKTNDGDFLIKHFKKDKVGFKEIEEAVKLAKENYSPLRLVCLAKSFDSKIINEINDSESYVIPFDIIQIKEKGFAAIKLSPTTN